MNARRAAAAAALSSLLLLAGPARAQTAADEIDTFAAGATALPVHVEVNLPAAVPAGPLGDLSSFTVDIAEVNGEAAGPAEGLPTAKADAAVLASSITALTTLVGEPVEASLDGEADAEQAVLAQDASIISVGVGEIEAHVKPVGDTSSAASLARFAVGLSGEGGGGGEGTKLVSLGAAQSTQRSGRDGDSVMAEATARIADVNVLGGLVTVGSVETTATASTSGKAGAAAASSKTTVTDLKVADVLTLTLGPDGASGTVLGNQLPSGDPGAVIDAVNGVLATAGVQIVAGDVEQQAAEDGSEASASSNGIGVIINPLKAAKPLVSLQLAPAGAAVAATRAAIPPDPQPDPDEEPRAPLDPPGDELPKTGGGRPAEAALAVLAAAGFLALSRGARRARAHPVRHTL